ncbi:MAG: zinc carboxypeptidase [Nitrosomonadales bacterium]|nr:zinc carboxypeptidase [Nitrosomonadales bacterium]
MPTLPELNELEQILELGRSHLEVRVACEVSAGNKLFPVYRLTLGNPDPTLPAIGFFGGIHGLERIGTQVLLYFLRGLIARLEWDNTLHHLLQDVRLVFMPLINPGGMWQSTRCNPQGVDLMRNAPIEATGKVPFLLGGHRISPHLPWYRGLAGVQMESENQALCLTVQEELLSRSFSIAVDCHSGFGSRDRIWFPHAHSVNPIAHLADIFTLEKLFQKIYPNNKYLFEPQSVQYRTHGDIWDYLYLQAQQDDSKTFLPLTLEMGSWLWVKKNPRQIFSRQGIFNPSVEHRLHRVLRGHTVWLDFLMRAASSYDNWLIRGDSRSQLQERAIARWFKQ